MFFESPAFTALFYGLISAATLPLGAAMGMFWRPPDRIMAILLAFGGGALLAALTIDLIAPGVEAGHFFELALGAIAGGFLFKLLDWLVNRKGGYLRKPSTALTYWRKEARQKFRTVIGSLRRTQLLQNLSADAEDKLLSIMLVRDFPAGSCLYRADDPATNLYIIEAGEVELSDPQQGGRVFERLHKHDIFGRMSFRTGLHRATEAYAVKDTKLLIIPRDAFMDLLEDSEELREVVARGIGDAEVATYLHDRHGLSHAAITQWQQQATLAVRETGHYAPPISWQPIADNLSELLQKEQRLGFFAGLSDTALNQIAKRFIHKSNPQGYNFFYLGQSAERLYFLRKGTVYLFDPDDRSRKPVVVQAGELFGGLSFFTEGMHAVTAVGHDETEVSVLRHKDFELLLDEVPELRSHLSQFLRRHRVAQYLTEQHHLDPKKAANWIDSAAKSVAGGGVFPSLAEMTKQVAGHAGAAMAIFLGILLDGIPESLVIGANVLITNGISLSLLGGLFLANFPEALSSAAGMKEQGMKVAKILAMWVSLMLLTGIGAALGTILLNGAPPTVFALIEGIAAGAMLTVVAETMLPEAFHKGGGVVGISTLAGFLAAISFNTLG
jgi:CRP-like cAMP-binding protein